MSTTGQTALARGLTALKTVHASTWLHGAESFEGVAVDVSAERAQMLDAPEARIHLVVQTSDLPSPAPVRGESLKREDTGLFHRIERIHHEPTSAQTTILLTPSGFARDS